MSDALDACLPTELRGPTTSITPIARGMSGAGVYRVQAAGQTYVLKVAGENEPIAAWRQSVDIQRRAGDAGVAPRVIHSDEARRAVVSEHVVDRGFATRLLEPSTRADAIRQLGETLGRLHALPLPTGDASRDPREMIEPLWRQLAGFAIPGFARATIDRVYAETPPPRERALVTSHNDPNPSNIAFDGTRLVLLDWNTAGANDPFYDLAAVAMFLRMDSASASALIAAHDGAAPASLPERFVYLRRLIATLCATMCFQLARRAGHPGGDMAQERAPTLADVHGLLRTGMLALNTPEGSWMFGLALVRTITG